MLSSLGVAPVSGMCIFIFYYKRLYFITNHIFYVSTIYLYLLPDVLSSLSSMSSLTPEQSTNATPDASLQPSSMNSAQRYIYIIIACILFNQD